MRARMHSLVQGGSHGAYYALPSQPNATEGMQKGSVMVIVNASYWGDKLSYHMDVHPSILLARVCAQAVPCMLYSLACARVPPCLLSVCAV